MAHEIKFEDIVSKAVAKSYERIQTLGIYCWQPDKIERTAAFFLPRLSYNQNKDYLEKLYPGISARAELEGRGIFASVWKIARYYGRVRVGSPEETLSGDMHTLSAFKAWCALDPNLKSDDFLQVYVLSEEKTFAEFKYTSVQNPPATTYYSWLDILGKREISGR